MTPESAPKTALESQPFTAFNLPERLAAKADPTLIAADDEHFVEIAHTLQSTISELDSRLDAARRAPAIKGQEALQRDLLIHKLTARLRTLRRFGLDLTLGRMVAVDADEPVYVGRLGLTDSEGKRLLLDWRSPAAEPFFGATHADPMGLESRRRYRWNDGAVSDYWDEVFTGEGLEGRAALDDQTAFIASLGAERSPQMRDVLGTIAADQDAIIRESSRGALVVDGGPGTGKTVVALHRSAYLLYSDPRLGARRGGILFIGPHEPYLAYVGDVLPSLGEDGVRTCTLRDLLPEGADAGPEPDDRVAELKARVEMVAGIERAVQFYEEPPADGIALDIQGVEVWLSADDWATAFAAPDPGTPHNEARDQIIDEIVTILRDKYDDSDEEDQLSPELFDQSVRRNRELLEALQASWPLLEPTDLVGDLWSVPAYLRLALPSLSREEIALLQRTDPTAWTVSDLPILDAARHRLGDPEFASRKRRQEQVFEAELEERSYVIDHLIEAGGSDLGPLAMLRKDDIQEVLVDQNALPQAERDERAGPFSHVVVDEAQELTDAEWQMLLQRCPSRSFTIVGDRAQARHGFTESWQDRLERVGLHGIRQSSLTINYRTPAQIMAAAEPVIREVLPDANVPTSIRKTDVPVDYGARSELDDILTAWLTSHDEGVAAVIGDPNFIGTPRVRSLTPELAKGLEFDLVVLVDPERFGDGITGAVDRYVAMTRATSQLVILQGDPSA